MICISFIDNFVCILLGTPPVLSIPILQPCLRSEQLLVTIDTHTGVFTVHVPQYEDNPYVQDIQQCLNEDKSRLETLVSQLRFWMTKQRVHKTLQQLPATSHERLPILFDLNKHPLKVGKYRLFFSRSITQFFGQIYTKCFVRSYVEQTG